MKSLLKKLIGAKTTAETGELAAAKIIADEFRLCGIDSTIDNWGQNRANIVARIKSARSSYAILFACHLDVVPADQAGWNFEAFEAVESNGRIYGRGSADMKGSIAAVVTAIRQVVESGISLAGDIIFFAAAGEETDSCGTKRFVHNNISRLPRLAGVIVPEPTDFQVVTAHRGMLWLEVTTSGKSAHGSAPQLGINAIASMQAILKELENYRIEFKPHQLLGGCSMSVNTITGGNAINIVPDKCRIGIDIRTLPGQNYQDLLADFEKIFVKLSRANPQFDAKAAVIRQVGAMETDSSCNFTRDFCSAVGAGETKAVGFTTDGPYFASLGVPVVVFGPGRAELCHKPNEHIDLADLEKAVGHYKNVILKFLACPKENPP
jgi:succinyl-diaminopimelate desuccinylase